MSERIKQWWARNVDALAIPKAEWDELDAAIREDERARLITSTHEPSAGMIRLWREDAEKVRRWMGSAKSTLDRTTLNLCDAIGELSAEVERLRAIIGKPAPGSHPDEWNPRAGSWHRERENWKAEVETLRAAAATSAPPAPLLREHPLQTLMSGWNLVGDPTLPNAVVVLMQSGIEIARVRLTHGVRVVNRTTEDGGL